MSGDGRNKVVDGWRGLSVLAVIISHAISYRFGVNISPIREVLYNPVDLVENILLRVISSGGEIGVGFFLVISGYLITTLLIAEEKRNGSVSIRAFYVRRTFRIMPAFYLYLLAILCIDAWGPIIVNADAFVRSGFYVCNASGFRCSWWMAHTWSLSVEEQFYLCWPLLFVMLGSGRRTGIVVITVATAIGSWLFDGLGPFVHIAIGALMAVSLDGRKLIMRFASTHVIITAAILLMAQPLTFFVPTLALGLHLIKPLLIAIVFFGVLFNCEGGVVNKLIANKILTKIGLASYSLYLWQQISLAPSEWGGEVTGAEALYADFPVLMSLLFVPIAIISYNFVELPFIRIGRRFSNKILASKFARSNAEKQAEAD